MRTTAINQAIAIVLIGILVLCTPVACGTNFKSDHSGYIGEPVTSAILPGASSKTDAHYSRQGCEIAVLESTAIILVNSKSPDFADFVQCIQPYLLNFGVPYSLLDISISSIPASIGKYALIIIGHRNIDPEGAYLSPREQTRISNAVNGGTGIINFDNNLSVDGTAPRYQFIQDIFGFEYVPDSTTAGVSFVNGTRISCWEDDHQDPLLPTSTVAPNAHNDAWDEFQWSRRPYPAIFASKHESPGVMKFHGEVPNGTYKVIANLYHQDDLRYYYGFEASSPRERSVLVDDSTCYGFKEFELGKVTITDGQFALYTDGADVIADHGGRSYGWAWIRLEPEYLLNCWEDDHQNPMMPTSMTIPDPRNDAWDEFQWSRRPYPAVFASKYERPGVMKFSRGVPNGTYKVIANLYHQDDLRYYYGFDEGNPREHSVVVESSTSDGFGEFDLGTVTITDSQFTLYTDGADVTTDRDGISYGWAWIRLVPDKENTHYITALHPPGDFISTGDMTTVGIVLPGNSTVLVSTDFRPLLVVSVYGSGRTVQWGSYDWIHISVKGPLYGLDDLIWRSVVWAARKPIVLQMLPPFVAMRVDDQRGRTIDKIAISTEYGFKPWMGVFTRQFPDTEYEGHETHLETLRNLINAGKATASIHGLTWHNSSYWDHQNKIDYPASVLDANFAEGALWHDNNDIPISKFVLAHFAEIGVDSFARLQEWGVEFVGTFIESSRPWGSEWLNLAPYRLYEVDGLSNKNVPFAYADFLDVRISVWDDAHQSPVLDTIIWPRDFPVRPDHGDNAWGEFKWDKRNYPGVFAGISENPGLMQFYGEVPNGTYRVTANLYRKSDLRYFYGFDSSAPRAHAVDVTTGPIGDFKEFDLGTVTITDNHFSLYTDFAQVLVNRGGSFGWAWIRLRPVPREDGPFFNCLTCIEDDGGREWYPTNAVHPSVNRGAALLKGALDSRILAILFTHDSEIDPINESNWDAIMEGVTGSIASYSPEYVTMDYACQYIRAITTSDIDSVLFSPVLGSGCAVLAGRTDLPTRISVFSETGGTISETFVDVPVFEGTTTINFKQPDKAR